MTISIATMYEALMTRLLGTFAQTRPGTAVDSGYPPYHCIPLKVDSVDELTNYCEGWRAIRRGW